MVGFFLAALLLAPPDTGRIVDAPPPGVLTARREAAAVSRAPGVARSAPLAGRREPLYDWSVVPADTPTALPPLIDYPASYGTRVTIHKVASYAIIPLFAAQYYTGVQLMNKGESAPTWMRRAHGPLALGVGALFAVNTVTGVWNLWDARKDPEGRAWRTAHGLLMLVADAGFVATGLTAPSSEEALVRRGVIDPGATGGGGRGNRVLHRQLAIGSMAVALVSYVMMLPPFRRD